MKKDRDGIFGLVVKLISLFSSIILFFIISFIFRESLDFFRSVSIFKFITRGEWNPLGDPLNLSILPVILATVYVALVAIILALPLGVGASLALASYGGGRTKRYIRTLLDILAGIPSVVYGFMGLMVLVKFFEKNFKMASGESVLAGGVLLSFMVLPYIISTTSESMEKVYEKYRRESEALGVSRAYFIRNIVLRESGRSILAGTILAFGRAMGETMAVMMVIGNAPIMPRLLGKCQTISSLIALEMGMVEVGSLHYHALFSSGFILMLILIFINMVFYLIRKKIEI